MTKILIDEATVKLVLSALEAKDGWGSSIREAKEKAITALREALASEAKEQPAQQEPVLQDIEQYRMQIGGICTAAIGYWKEGDGIHPDYDTVALRNVAQLYAKYDELYRAQPAQQCKWPTCQSEEAQQALAEQIKRELVCEQPAQQEPVPWSQALEGVWAEPDDTTPQPAQQEPVANVWQMFAAYLIDKCEGEIISEEGLQRSLADMLADPQYTTPQPAQQEPFGYFKAEPFGWTDCAETDEGAVALYTSPQPAQRKPLTEEEIMTIGRELGAKCRLGGNPNIDFDYARAIEAAHGIKEQP